MIDPDSREGLLNWLLLQFAEQQPALPVEAPGFTSADWVFFIEGLQPDYRLPLWIEVPDELKGESLTLMNDDVRRRLVDSLTTRQLIDVLGKTSPDHLVEVLGVMPKSVLLRALKRLDDAEQETLRSALSYSDNQIGRYVSRGVLTADLDSTVAITRSMLKATDVPELTDRIFVTDDDDCYLGHVLMSDLDKSHGRTVIRDLLQDDSGQIIHAEDHYADAAKIVKDSNCLMLPVVTEKNELLGRITLRTAFELVVDDYENQLMHQGGVADEDLFAPIRISVVKRGVWLGINLATAFLAAWVIGLFELALSKIVALAVLMPVVASMGGIAGSQTLTLTIRGLATGQVTGANLRLLGDKEVRIGFMNGLFWSLIVAVVAQFWFDNLGLSLVIALAIWVNVLVAAVSGILVPVILDRAGVDPALAGSVILTTVTDVVGFFAFLGTATVFLI